MSVALVLAGRAVLLGTPATRGDDLVVRSFTDALDTRPEGMSRYGRLDRYGKALARVCAEAVRGKLPEGTGLAVASLESCHETNSQFDQELIEKGPQGASPLLFPYTLPGAAASEVAMHLGLRGPYRVYPGGPSAGLLALLTTAEATDEREMPAGVVATSDVLGPYTLAHRRDAGELPHADDPPLGEAAVALSIARPDAGLVGPRLGLEGALGPGNPSFAEIRALTDEALERAGLVREAVRQVVSATSDAALAAREQRAFSEASLETEVLQLRWRVGDTGASLGLLAFLAALEGDGPALVVACDRNASIALAIPTASMWSE